jgi:hypothetical protein
MMTSGATLLGVGVGACDRDGDGVGGRAAELGAGDVPDAEVACPHAVTIRNRALHSTARMCTFI